MKTPHREKNEPRSEHLGSEHIMVSVLGSFRARLKIQKSGTDKKVFTEKIQRKKKVLLKLIFETVSVNVFHITILLLGVC